jgi:hypothetical protein
MICDRLSNTKQVKRSKVALHAKAVARQDEVANQAYRQTNLPPTTTSIRYPGCTALFSRQND